MTKGIFIKRAGNMQKKVKKSRFICVERQNMLQNNDKNENADLIFLDGLFFLRPQAIKENSNIVQEAFKDMFKAVSYN